jgi:hypothetical protein
MAPRAFGIGFGDTGDFGQRLVFQHDTGLDEAA